MCTERLMTAPVPLTLVGKPPPAAADGEVVAHDNTAPLLQGEVLVARAPGEAEPLEAVVLHVEPPTAEAVQAYAVEEPVATDVSDANPF